MPAKKLPKLNIQHVFGLAFVLKVISSVASVPLNSPWILGLCVPLIVMTLYMVIGYYCREDDVSLEKFADSCYYLGFIFTITSIVASLFDLPNLGASEGLRNISLRFGAAMISTILGMGFRVYHVGFQKDADDAVRDAEVAIIDATRRFVSQLVSVTDNLKQFELQVLDASKLTVENVHRQVEALGYQYAQSLNDFYGKLTEENRLAFSALIDEVKASTTRLSDSVDMYSDGIKENVAGIERRVIEFADTVTSRLSTTTFPDDFFSSRLQEPLTLLKNEAAILGASVQTVAAEVQTSSSVLAETLKKISSKSKKAEGALDSIAALSEQQRKIVENADAQLQSMGSIVERLTQIDQGLQFAVRAIGTNSSTSSELVTKLATFASESAALQAEIKDAMGSLLTRLDANAALATGVVEKLEAQASNLYSSAVDVVAKLDKTVETSGLIVDKVGEANCINEQVAKHLHELAASNSMVIPNVRVAAESTNVAATRSGEASRTSINTAVTIEKAASPVTVVARYAHPTNTTSLPQSVFSSGAVKESFQGHDIDSVIRSVTPTGLDVADESAVAGTPSFSGDMPRPTAHLDITVPLSINEDQPENRTPAVQPIQSDTRV